MKIKQLIVEKARAQCIIAKLNITACFYTVQDGTKSNPLSWGNCFKITVVQLH